jgi:flagellar hook assembly protein FlgD
VQAWTDNDIIVKGPKDGPEYMYYVCGVDSLTSTDGYEATVNQFGEALDAHVGVKLAEEESTVALPAEFSVGNYPNPFNPSTTISYLLAENSSVRLEIYDVAGRKVRSLVDESRSAGYHNVVWNGRDQNGSQVSSGVYLYRFTATPISGGKAFTQSGKLALMK